MSKIRKISVCLFYLALGACASYPKVYSAFDQADVNHDGHVSLDEWRAIGGQELAFMAADIKHTGLLDRDEFEQARQLSAAAQGDARDAGKVSDKLITQNVEHALKLDRTVNGWSIHVDTYQSNVQLTGTVRTEEEKQKAEAIARSVDGVGTVFNNISLKD